MANSTNRGCQQLPEDREIAVPLETDVQVIATTMRDRDTTDPRKGGLPKVFLGVSSPVVIGQQS